MIKDFEQALSVYTGAPYVVTTDCCTHALELCFYNLKPRPTTCVSHTYVSVPMMLFKTGIIFSWDNTDWEYEYQFGDSGIWDSARAFDKDMYRSGQLQCLSFGNTKRLDLKRGGAILLDDEQLYQKLKRQRYDGRDFIHDPWYTQELFELGFHYRMDWETAAEGLHKLNNNLLNTKQSQKVEYPDCSKIRFII